MSAGMLLATGCILGGIGYGILLAYIADSFRRDRRKRSRQEWRQMGGGRW